MGIAWSSCSFSYIPSLLIQYQFSIFIIYIFNLGLNYGIMTEMKDKSLTTQERVQVELLTIPHCNAIAGVVAAMLLVAIIVIQILVVLIVVVVIRLR